MFEVHGLSKWFGGRERPAVANLSFSVAPGEIVGLVGLNGAGKTTTLRIAAGVSLPTEGDVTVDGKSITTEKAKASWQLGWVPEIPVHDPSRSIGGLLDYYADMAGAPAESDSRQLLAQWGIAPLARRHFRTLSLGERKRFAIAVAASRNPTYYLLDEVFNGLDAAGVAQVRDWMFEQRKTDHGLLVSSHQLRELQTLADRFAFLHEGRLIGDLSAEQIPVSMQSRLLLVIHPINDAALNLLRSFGLVERTSNGVTLTGTGLDAGKVNRALVEAGYEVDRLEASSPDLESYFLQKVRENR